MSNDINLQELMASQAVSEVADLPDLATLPSGRWVLGGVSVKIGETATSKNPKVGVTMKVVECVELSKAEVAAGVDPEKYPAETMAHFTFSDKEVEKVLSRLKKPFGATMEEHGMTTFAELMDQFDQLTFMCDVTRRKAPDFDEDDPRYFGELVSAVIS